MRLEPKPPAATSSTLGSVAFGRVPTERRRLAVADALLAVVVAAFALLDVLLSPDWRGPSAVNAVIVPAMALALAWRRHRPLTVLAVDVAGIVFLSLAFGGSQAWSNVFITVIAVYSAMAYAANVPAAVVLAAVGTGVHDLRDPMVNGLGDALWSSSLVVLTVLAGLAGRALRLRTDVIDERTEELRGEESAVASAAAEEERRRIARELHDIISHSLGVLVLQAGAAEQILDRDPDGARLVLKAIREMGQDAIGQMGTLLGLVRSGPDVSREPQPTLADLDRLVEQTRQAGVAVDVSIQGDARLLPAAVELSAYRVVQEGLTNIVKHALPAQARVTVDYRTDEVEVGVIDDGTDGHQGQGSRRGLAGLSERVSVFGGRFEAGPRPDRGWAVRAVFPISR